MVREGHATYVRVESLTTGLKILTLYLILASWASYVRCYKTARSSMTYLKPLYEQGGAVVSSAFSSRAIIRCVQAHCFSHELQFTLLSILANRCTIRHVRICAEV